MIKRTLYFGNPAYLSLRNSQLVVRLPEIKELRTISEKDAAQSSRTIPIEDIGFVVLDNQQITITQGLIDALVANNCALVSCNKSHMPSGLFLPLSGNTLVSERFRAQINCSIPLRKQLWQQTVKAKIINQACMLSLHTYANTGCMQAWADEVRSNDSTNLEARAAAYYWKSLFSEDSAFRRDPDGDYPNNFFNYGYALLRAVIARALVCAGLLPTLGIHHCSRYDAYCLADDIMEPYRPYVDNAVMQVMASCPDEQDLTKDIKRMLLNIPVLDVSINGNRCPLMVGASYTAASLVKCFAGESKKIVYPDMRQ